MASTVINTKQGKLSWTTYNKLVKEHGTQRKVAEEMGVAPSTVRNWGLRLRKVRNG